MERLLVALSLLILALTWTVETIPVLPDPLYPTQESFDLTKFLGTWYDVAFATTCPNLPRHRAGSAVGKLQLQQSGADKTLQATRTSFRRGICKKVTQDYAQTSTPGRFYYQVQETGARVDAYVVHTNYNEYALMITSKTRSSGDKIVTARLYTRAMTVRPSLLEDFKTLVRLQGMDENTIVIKENKDDCVPGEQISDPVAPIEPQRARRAAVSTLPLASVDVEGSGAEEDSALFNGTEACKAAPDVGPCFGMSQRYFYNSSRMSCELFTYGGCLGNQNNFVTERECLQRCRTEAVCRLPMKPQPCIGNPPTWAFDSSTGVCVPSKDGFCQADGNKFYTKAECEEYCGVMKEDQLLLSS